MWVAPLLTARLARSIVLAIVLPLLAIDLILVGVFVARTVGVIVGIVVGGLFLGVLNTVLTESVMEATDLPRSVASSAYSFVRFIGGAAAPPLAAAVAAATGQPSIAFYVGSASVLVATVLIVAGRTQLRRIDGAEETPRQRRRPSVSPTPPERPTPSRSGPRHVTWVSPARNPVSRP